MTDETNEVISAVKEMFSVLNSKMDNMNIDLITKMNAMNVDLIAKMDNMNSDLNAKMDAMDKRLIKIETTQETVINKNIQLLVEGYSAMSEKLVKLDTLSEDMENVKIDVDVIKKAVETNFEEHTVLAKIAKAK